MDAQRARIKTHMQVISADGRRVGYVERITETEIFTHFPCHRISLASIRHVTDDVYISERYGELQGSTPPNAPPDTPTEGNAENDYGHK